VSVCRADLALEMLEVDPQAARLGWGFKPAESTFAAANVPS